LREHKAKPNAVTNVSVVCHSSTSDLTESVW
jgi:hypothetical protein